jgi:hypothetical protein
VISGAHRIGAMVNVAPIKARVFEKLRSRFPGPSGYRLADLTLMRMPPGPGDLRNRQFDVPVRDGLF